MARVRKSEITHPVTFGLWQKVIAPIIGWCDAEYGRRAKLLEAFTAFIAPETVTRQVMESWISTNPETRTEPMLGNGLALLEVARSLQITTSEPPTSAPHE